MPRAIEILEGENGITVIDHTGGTFAAWLAPDEALFTVAQLLMDQPPRYMRSYAHEIAWQTRYRERPQPPVALLEDLRVRGPGQLTIAIGAAQVVKVRDDQGEICNTYIRLKGHA